MTRFINRIHAGHLRWPYSALCLGFFILSSTMVACTPKPVWESYQAVSQDSYYNRLMTDMKFHLTLASISQCRIQLKMLQELFDMLLLKYTRNLVLLGIMDTSLNEHENIFSSLEDKDAKSLEKALFEHLDHVRTHITEGFKRMFVRKKESMVDLFTFQ